MARDRIDADQARRILAAQASRDRRLALADEILENSGNLDQLDRQVAALHQHYSTLAAARTA
jgi:dephospho-CoA kinase